MKKTAAILAGLLLCFACFGAFAETGESKPVTLNTLLADLVDLYEKGGDLQRIDTDLEALQNDVADAIAEHWKKVYLDPEYKLNLYGTDDPKALPITGAHAFVVLGYELRDGEMTDELTGRCDAAAAAAAAFPDSIVICSGGATGPNNPDKHTEAGLMKEYLVHHCGIAPERVFTDESAMTTAQNAINTFTILREQGIETMTIVTSTYHQRWGQVLYNALAARYRRVFGYNVEIISNFCFDVTPSNPMYLMGHRIAVTQLGSILSFPLQPDPQPVEENP